MTTSVFIRHLVALFNRLLYGNLVTFPLPYLLTLWVLDWDLLVMSVSRAAGGALSLILLLVFILTLYLILSVTLLLVGRLAEKLFESCCFLVDSLI